MFWNACSAMRRLASNVLLPTWGVSTTFFSSADRDFRRQGHTAQRSNTSRAAASRPLVNASNSAASSTTDPRAVLDGHARLFNAASIRD